MSVPRYRPNKYFIPGLSEIWQPQGAPNTNNNKTSKDNVKKKEMYKVYEQELFIPSKVKSKKHSDTSRKKKDMVLSFEGIKSKGLGSYRYFDTKINNSSRKEIEKYKLRDRSSFLESYRPTSRTSHNASTSRIEQSYSKDSRRLYNKSKLREEVEMVSRLSEAHPNDNLRKGKLLFNQGKMNEAESIFKQLLKQQASVLDSHYFLGIIQIRRGQYQQAIDHLNNIVFANQLFKKSVYLFLSMAYKGAHMNQQSLDIANKGLRLFPNYFDLMMYKGKLQMMARLFQQAEKTYSEAIGIKSDFAEAYFKRVQCLVQMGYEKKAISILTTLLYIDKDERGKILEERAKLLFKTHQIEQCKKDIERVIDMKLSTSDIYLLKGQVEESDNRITEAILCYEQSISLNTSRISVEKSLVSITKCKINDLDYYSAFHQISRSLYLNLKSKIIDMYRLLTEGVVFLMKRKIQQGLNNLNALLSQYILNNKKQKPFNQTEQQKSHIDYILKRFYVYRAYGYFMLGKHQLSINDYVEAQKYISLQRHSRYNLTLAEGIVEVNNRNYAKSFEYFQKARSIYPTKLEPLLYRAVTLVEQSFADQSDDVNKLESILLALKQLDTAYDLNNNHSNLLFIRTLLYFYLGKIHEGLESISRAMAKSEQNVPKYFFYRGLGHGALRNYKQCQNDFTIVINLNNNFAEAYLERAKTLFINQNIQKAMDDIDQYIKNCPSVDRNFLQGNLHFAHQNFQTALLKYQQAIQDEQTTLMKVKCFICIGQLKFALNCLEQLNKFQFECDRIILKYLAFGFSASVETLQSYLRSLNQNVNVCHQIFNVIHVYSYMASIYFQMGKYKQAEQQFKRAYKERQFYNIEYLINKQQFEDDEAGEQAQLQMNQINYNLFICYLMQKQMKKAHDIFIRHILPIKDLISQGEILTELCHMIFQSIKGVNDDQQIVNELDITMFTNPLSDVSPNISIRLKNGRLKTKLCHILPSIILKQMKPEVNQKVILSKIRLQEIQNKPEPPWVRRNDQATLIFTGEIQDVGIDFHTEENQETTEYQEQQQQKQEEESSQQSSNTYTYSKPDNMKNQIEKLKNVFKLDDSIERKLNTFIKKTK